MEEDEDDEKEDEKDDEMEEDQKEEREDEHMTGRSSIFKKRAGYLVLQFSSSLHSPVWCSFWTSSPGEIISSFHSGRQSERRQHDVSKERRL